MGSLNSSLASSSVIALVKLFFSKVLSGFPKYLITEKFAVEIFVEVLEHFAKKTTTKLDDDVVARIKAVLSEFEQEKTKRV